MPRCLYSFNIIILFRGNCIVGLPVLLLSALITDTPCPAARVWRRLAACAASWECCQPFSRVRWLLGLVIAVLTHLGPGPLADLSLTAIIGCSGSASSGEAVESPSMSQRRTLESRSLHPSGVGIYCPVGDGYGRYVRLSTDSGLTGALLGVHFTDKKMCVHTLNCQ